MSETQRRDAEGTQSPLRYSVRNGECVAVIRPDNPEMAIAESLAAIKEFDAGNPQATLIFDSVLAKQEYTFVGYLLVDGRLADQDGNLLSDSVRPGDSFVSASAILKFERGEKTGQNKDDLYIIDGLDLSTLHEKRP